MVIKLTCPNGHRLAAKDSKAGTTGTCPACGAKIQIPAANPNRCTDSAVLRILGIGNELNKSVLTSRNSVNDTLLPSDFQGAYAKKTEKKVRSTQICPQCDWEIDVGYRVCPHCHYYLMGQMGSAGKS